ncbi:MAG: DUF2304 domain-containing protein [Planctomycetes bacterium]|nr:DUF2304 domain-containing protein [Planctomycetota bacterium]
MSTPQHFGSAMLQQREATRPFLSEAMSTRQQWVAIALAVVMTIWVLELVRRRKLREELAVVWFATALALLALAVNHDLLDWFRDLIGAAQGTSALFFGAIVFLMLLSLQFSIRLTKLAFQNKALAQRMVLLEEELQRARAQAGSSDPPSRPGSPPPPAA